MIYRISSSHFELFEISVLAPPSGIAMNPEDWVKHGCGYIIKEESQLTEKGVAKTVKWCSDCSKPVNGPQWWMKDGIPTGEKYWMCGLCKRMIEDAQNVEKTMETEK